MNRTATARAWTRLLCLAFLALGSFSAWSAQPIKLALIEGLSGPFGNTGAAVVRNLTMAIEEVNARGGVNTNQGKRPLALLQYDSKSNNEAALTALQAAVQDGASYILQGNSSATATALIEAINKHNKRDPAHRVLFLNYAAVEPSLTNDRCSLWHYRFDAHADMRMTALMEVLRADQDVRSVYLIGQDYSFGRAVVSEARRQLQSKRSDIQVVGEDLHPIGKIKDFLPYISKIKASGAQAVITGNWGNDLTLLVKAARDGSFQGKFYTFYGNALGAPAAIGEAGVDRVVAVAEWMPNASGTQSEAFYKRFLKRFPDPTQDYAHLRMHMMIQALASAIEKAGSTDAIAVGKALENAQVTLAGQTGAMREQDHQFQQPLMVAVMQRKGSPGVPFGVEGTDYGFKIIKRLAPEQVSMPTNCEMQRP
jgi:branched-chain amino acid transport system substrate-binding protein